MINIRSITLGVDWADQSKHGLADEIERFMATAEVRFAKSERAVRTCRLTLPPLNQSRGFSPASTRSVLGWVSDLCERAGIRWFCVPFNYLGEENPRVLSKIAAEVVARYSNAFVNLIVAKDDEISPVGITEAARFVRTVSRFSNNGFDNFRVGVSCNCAPHTPFFPFAYHQGVHGFSVALETVDAFIDIISKHENGGVEIVRDALVGYLRENLVAINDIGMEIEIQTGVRFLGIDASLAPFPNGESSVARVVEMLSHEDFGSFGSLYFTSFLTDIIKVAIHRSRCRYVGFNGVMYSLLEDDYLARRNKQKNLTLDGLILYSSVCGCGIDMVPVAGDILEEEIESLILDTAGLAITLRKPLGVRVLPINGRSPNEVTSFNYDFLVDTRIMKIRNRGFDRAVIHGKTLRYLRDQ